MRITITRADGMTDIVSEEFSYSVFDGMYKTGDGVGFQGTGDEIKDHQIQGLCEQINRSIKGIEHILCSEGK